MRKPIVRVIGIVLVLAGAVFTLQGLNVLHGSSMSGSGFWAVAGPVIVVIGLVLVVAGTRPRVR